MKFFKNRVVAWILTALVILGCLGYGISQRPTEQQVPELVTTDTVPIISEVDWVNDDAGILSDAAEQKLNAYNAKWDSSYHSVLAVATVNSVKGADLEEYTYDYGSDWGLGQNDMLLLLAVQDNDYYFVLSGSEIVPDERVKDAFLGEFYDDYDRGDYDEAFLKFFTEMDNVYQIYAPASVSGTGSNHVEVVPYSDASSTLAGLICILILAIVVFSIIDRARYRRWYNLYGGVVSPTVRFVPLIFWHRPGGLWFRRMDKRYAPRTYTTTSRPGSGSVPHSGYRPTTHSNYRPGSFGGSSFGGHSSSGFSRSSGSFSSRGGSFGGSRGGGFGGGGRGGFGGHR